MLAEFYTNAMLLRYEHPMMIITKTKDIFMKRLKRNKKMLTEEGSSDESKTNTLSRSIQLHTNTFLDSVDSSQLSKKTNQLREELFPEFKQKDSHNQSYDSQIHDINYPEDRVENIRKKELMTQGDHSIADKLIKLTKNLVSKNENVVDSQTLLKINLSPKETDLNYLICDFDEIDKEKVTNQYKKLQKKQQKSFYSKSPEDQSNRFRRKQQMHISPLNFNDQNFNHEKTLQSPKNRKQIQHNVMEIQPKKKNSFETQNINHKIPIYHPMINYLSNNASEQRFEELEESYKTLQRFKPETYRKHNQHETRQIYENYDYRSRQKVNSYRQNFLPRQNRITNNFHLSKYQNNGFNDYEQPIERKRKTQYHEQKSPYQSTQKYQTNLLQQGYVQEYKTDEQNRMKYQSPKFKDLKQHEHRTPQYQHFQTENIKKQKPYEKMTKIQYIGKSDDKKASQPIIDDIPSVSYHQSDLDDKLEKKRRIREKAAQLLSRVRSHQYLTTRIHVPYHHRY